MMNINIKTFYKNPLFILFLFIIITIIFILFKFETKSNDLNTLKNIGSNISEINFDFNINNENINSESYIKSMEKKVLLLKDIELSINNLSLKKDYNLIVENIKAGLKSNISLYEHLISILSTSSAHLPKSYDEILSIKNKTEEFFNTCVEDGVPIYLTNENSHYLDDILFYVNELIKLNRDKDIQLKQKNEFILSIDVIRKDLNKLMENLFDTISLIKSENRDINVLVTDVHKKILDFQNLKNKLYLISIPKNSNDCFNNLEKILSNYEEYINSFLNALNNEIKNNASSKDSYEDAHVKYLEVQKAIENFDKIFEEFKNN